MTQQFNALHDSAFIANPLPQLRAAWDETPIVRHDNMMTTFSVFSHEDVRAVFTNTAPGRIRAIRSAVIMSRLDTVRLQCSVTASAAASASTVGSAPASVYIVPP